MRNQLLWPIGLLAVLALAASPIATLAQTPESFTLGPPRNFSAGPWREIGRSTEVGGFRQLAVVDGRLFASAERRGWYSDDGRTWTQSRIPGNKARLKDIDTARGRLYAVGTIRYKADKKRAAVWSTGNGKSWTRHRAPSVASLRSIAARGNTLLALAPSGRLWLRKGDGKWRSLRRPAGVRDIAAGPSGFLAWTGGGQDIITTTKVWRSSDGKSWARVALPKSIPRKDSGGHFGVAIYPGRGRWLMFSNAPQMHVSSDAKTWRPEPRPKRMELEGVWWAKQVGPRIQLGHATIGDPRFRIWSWKLGTTPGPAWTTRAGIGRPVAWNGTYYALGRDWPVTLWRWR